MKYLLMCCFDEYRWEEIPKPQRDEIMEAYGDWVQDTAKSGRHIATEKLGPTSAARTVRVAEGKPLITDGPFAETAEQLGGYHLIECGDLDEAVSIAQRIPTLPFGGKVEVRPVESA